MDFNTVVSLIMSNALFYIFALIILIFAVLMVSSKNLVHSALFMIVVFIGVACVYVMLQADFLAVVQILVYVGAISILLVFGVMLTRRDDMSRSNPGNDHRKMAFFVSLVLFGVIVWKVLATKWPIIASEAVQPTVGPIADLLLGKYIVPFEAAAVLLLVAMAGAIILGKGADITK